VKEWREAGMPDDWTPLTPPNPAASPRKCRRHLWILTGIGGGYAECNRCGAIRNDAAARRGRNNRARGNSIEREVGKRLGLRRVGQYGGPDDLSGELFAAQVKSGGAFSERLWSWLKAVPVNAGQTALLVVTDAPGPGHRRRAMVILDLDDWADLHAGTPEAP
jgi:hypothetical protein